jgi:hypothetical protein
LTYDNNDEDDATSLDAMSVSTGGVSTQTHAKGHKAHHNKNQLESNENNKVDEQLKDDLKDIDDKCNNI